jgi:hypothetical protein
VSSHPEPSDDELVAFAESLLQNLAPRLREREVLEDAIRQHRGTWVTLYDAAAALKRAKSPG